GAQRTIVFTNKTQENRPNLNFIKLDFNENLIENILAELFKNEIQSVIIEGGQKTLNFFIEKNMWDEARVFTSLSKWKNGVKSPVFGGELIDNKQIGTDK